MFAWACHWHPGRAGHINTKNRNDTLWSRRCLEDVRGIQCGGGMHCVGCHCTGLSVCSRLCCCIYLCSFIASNLVPPFQCFLNGFVCVCSMLSRRISVLFTVETPGHASNDNPGHYAPSDLCGHLSWIKMNIRTFVKKCRCFVKSSNPRFVFWSASSKLLFFPICRIHAERRACLCVHGFK